MKVKKFTLLLLSFIVLLSTSFVYSESGSSPFIKFGLDRTTAKVGDIITGTVSINDIAGFAGYQVNIKYDPAVLQPVHPDTGEPYLDSVDSTMPEGNTVITKSGYTPLPLASHDFSNGILNFANAYMNLPSYKNSGAAETTGTLVIVGFKVLKAAPTAISFADAKTMPGAKSGTSMFNWDGATVTDYEVIQPPSISIAEDYTPVPSTPASSAPSAPAYTQAPASNGGQAGTPASTPAPTPTKAVVEQTDEPKPGIPAEDIAVSVSSDKNVYKEQQTVEYTIKYINRLDKAAEDITVTAEIPKFTVIDNDGGGTVKDGTIQWNIKSLQPGRAEKITYRVKVGSLDEGEIFAINNVSIGSGEDISLSSIKILLCSDRFEKGSHKGYVTGYPDNLFKPDKEITRAEIAALFARILNLDVSGGKEQIYADVPANHWAAGYINAVSQKGLFKGYANNTFNPNGSITRAELATAIFRCLELQEIVPIETHFNDIANHWAFKYIEEIYRLKLINGYSDNTFMPDKKIKRSEAVTMLNKMLFRGPVTGAASTFSDVPQSHWAVGQIEEAVRDHTYTRNDKGEEVIS